MELRSIRQEKGLTQVQAAQILGVSRRTYIKYENDEGKLSAAKHKYDVEYCYIFGSYAKGKQTEKSDVDLLVAMPVNGLKFFGLVETLREKLRKKVDVLDLDQLNNNTVLVREILKDGIKIYG